MAKSKRPKPKKPAGLKAPIEIGSGGLQLRPISFPADKKAREKMIAGAFAANLGKFPDPLVPLSIVRQNEESDLDFTIDCADGQRRKLELCEFAPLANYGHNYANVPVDLTFGELADEFCKLVSNKSDHQGGAGHVLLVYVTEGALSLPPPAQELIRRQLSGNVPRFDSIYYFSPHSETEASIDKIYPSDPHPWFGSWEEIRLRTGRPIRLDLRRIDSATINTG